jgi:hypothetical protein
VQLLARTAQGGGGGSQSLPAVKSSSEERREKAMTYVHQEYPKWVKDKIVQNAEEEKALLAESSPSAEVPSEKADEGAVAETAAPSVPEPKKKTKGK